jgi:hypothetical protein
VSDNEFAHLNIFHEMPFDPTGLPSSRVFSLWEPDTDISDHDADLIDQCLADLTAKRARLDAAMNAAAAIRSEDHAALFEDYMVVVYQISRMRAGIHPMVVMLEECPALAPLRDLHNQLRRLL